jgi:hypothetical protein
MKILSINPTEIEEALSGRFDFHVPFGGVTHDNTGSFQSVTHEHLMFEPDPGCGYNVWQVYHVGEGATVTVALTADENHHVLTRVRQTILPPDPADSYAGW